MFIPGRYKTIPNVPDHLRQPVIMAIRIIEGKAGKKVELAGAEPTKEKGYFDIKYRTKKFKDPKEVERQQKELETWIKENPEKLQEALLWLKNLMDPLVKIAQKMGLKPKIG